MTAAVYRVGDSDQNSWIHNEQRSTRYSVVHINRIRLPQISAFFGGFSFPFLYIVLNICREKSIFSNISDRERRAQRVMSKVAFKGIPHPCMAMLPVLSPSPHAILCIEQLSTIENVVM